MQPEKKMEKLMQLNQRELRAWQQYEKNRDVKSLNIILDCVKSRQKIIGLRYKNFTESLENQK